MTSIRISWKNFPTFRPTLGFGLYPIMYNNVDDDCGILKYGYLYYYPQNEVGSQWQEDGVCWDEVVKCFLDISVYPIPTIRIKDGLIIK